MPRQIKVPLSPSSMTPETKFNHGLSPWLLIVHVSLLRLFSSLFFLSSATFFVYIHLSFSCSLLHISIYITRLFRLFVQMNRKNFQRKVAKKQGEKASFARSVDIFTFIIFSWILRTEQRLLQLSCTRNLG